ncbi:hypothetical protein U0K82_003415, partial [Vibrio metschnikovii]|nr:hypothetical protein [Vibrio metschnikovii]
MKRYYLLFALLFYSSFSFASYRITSSEISGALGKVFPTPESMDSFFIGKCLTIRGKSVRIDRLSNAGSRSRSYGGLIYTSGCQKVDFGNMSGTVYFDPFQCPSGTKLNASTNQCEPDNICEELKAKDAPPPATPFPPSDRPITAPRLYCNTSNHCEAMRSYSNSGGELVRSFFYTGNKCV